MSGSYRDYQSKTFGWIGRHWPTLAIGIIGFVLAAIALNYGCSWQSEYEREARERSQEYQQYAYYPELRACGVIPPVARQKCIAEARKAERANARDERDLEAQRVTALWTGIMGIAAVTGMILSAVGVWLVWTTFRETRRAATIAERNLASYREAERGHCEIVIIGGYKPADSALVKYTVRIKNVGRSSVKILAIRYANLRDSRSPDTYIGATFEEFSLESGAESNPSPLVRGSANVERNRYIGGFVEYRCKFGEMHRTYFCYEVRENRRDTGLISPYTHSVAECRRERDWPPDT